MDQVPSFDDVAAAYERIRPYVNRTPVFTSASLNKMLQTQLFFKCENFQKSGSFKIRGATNALLALSAKELKRGVATVSSGNHGAALALAAKGRGIDCYVIMPQDACLVKKAAIEAYGGRVIFCEPGLEGREAKLKEVLTRTGAKEIHASDNMEVISGQGTLAAEFLQEIEHLDSILVPVGGGGLASGICVTMQAISPSTHIIGVEPEVAADGQQSLAQGKLLQIDHPHSVADGLLTSLCQMTFEILNQGLQQIVTVSEKAIVTATRSCWERMKIIIEPSAAVGIAALMEKKLELPGERVGVILSGGNVDLGSLPWGPRALK